MHLQKSCTPEKTGGLYKIKAEHCDFVAVSSSDVIWNVDATPWMHEIEIESR
jgi:hypothetical protein